MDFQRHADEIGISVEAYKKLCSTFLETTKKDLSALLHAVEAEKRDEISSLAHHIKGSAANMEFEELSSEAKALQTASSEAPLSELRQRFGSIETMFEEIEAGLGEDI